MMITTMHIHQHHGSKSSECVQGSTHEMRSTWHNALNTYMHRQHCQHRHSHLCLSLRTADSMALMLRLTTSCWMIQLTPACHHDFL